MLLKYILSALVLVALNAPAFANIGALQTTAKQAILIDFETGQVLFEKDADQRMPTSSMSKVMTVYLVFDALEKGKISLDDRFTVSEKAWRKGGSKMFVEVDKQVKIKDLLRGVIVQSGNDATIVLAEGLAGSEGEFASAMTRTAHEIGMNNSNFTNASGWPDPNHYSTARDLATLGVHMIRNFPDYYPYYKEKEFKFNNIKQSNRNPLLYRNMGADGIKTGHTEIGGYGLIGSGTRNGRRVIMVVNGLDSEKSRAQQGAKILEYGLNSFENRKLFEAGAVIETVDVVMGEEKTVPLIVEDEVFLTLPSLALNAVSVEIKYNGPLLAPVMQGQEVGTLIVNIPNMHSMSYPLVVAQDVAKLGLVSGVFSKIKLAFKRGE